MNREKKEYGSWWVWITVLIIGTVIIFTALSYVGIIGETIVERKVFENSYQKRAADEDALTTYDAQISLLRRKLNNSSDLSPEERNNLQAQIDAISILKSSKEN